MPHRKPARKLRERLEALGVKKSLNPQSRSALRALMVCEDRCVVCGKWVIRKGSRPRVTCGPSHRRQLARIRARAKAEALSKEPGSEGDGEPLGATTPSGSSA